MIERVIQIIANATTVGVLGLSLLVFACVFLYLAHRSDQNPVNFAHTLQDVDGRTSLRKLGEWVCLLASTWIVVYLATTKQLTDWMFAFWLIAWVARAALGPIIGARAEAIAKAADEPR